MKKSIALLILFFLTFGTLCFSQEMKYGYYPDGKVRYKGYFADGKPVGELIRYYPEGAVQAKMNHRGDTVIAVLYSRDGEFTSSGKYFRQKKTGTWEYRKRQAVIAREEFKDDRLCGKSLRYGKENIVLEEKNWEDGKTNGEWKLYYNNGQLRMQAFFIAGALNGMLQSYSRDGKLRTKGIYKDNLKEGEWEFYDETGKLVKKQLYQGGKAENAEEQELEESRELDALIESGRKIADPAVFADDPEAYMKVTGME